MQCSGCLGDPRQDILDHELQRRAETASIEPETGVGADGRLRLDTTASKAILWGGLNGGGGGGSGGPGDTEVDALKTPTPRSPPADGTSRPPAAFVFPSSGDAGDYDTGELTLAATAAAPRTVANAVTLDLGVAETTPQNLHHINKTRPKGPQRRRPPTRKTFAPATKAPAAAATAVTASAASSAGETGISGMLAAKSSPLPVMGLESGTDTVRTRRAKTLAAAGQGASGMASLQGLLGAAAAAAMNKKLKKTANKAMPAPSAPNSPDATSAADQAPMRLRSASVGDPQPAADPAAGLGSMLGDRPAIRLLPGPGLTSGSSPENTPSPDYSSDDADADADDDEGYLHITEDAENGTDDEMESALPLAAALAVAKSAGDDAAGPATSTPVAAQAPSLQRDILPSRLVLAPSGGGSRHTETNTDAVSPGPRPAPLNLNISVVSGHARPQSSFRDSIVDDDFDFNMFVRLRVCV